MNKPDTSQITVRKVDPLLKRRIAMAAKLKSQSINDWALDAMRAKAGLAPGDDREVPSWQEFVGSVSAGGFDKATLDDFEKIDDSMWDSK